MIFAFVLLCSTAISGPDCQPDTAREIHRVTDDVGNFAVFDQPMACLRDTIVWAAANVKPQPGFWPKLVCEHSRPTNQG